MINILYQLVRTVRPRQWLKNSSLFAALAFSGNFFVPRLFEMGVQAFVIFCAISSSTYIINDIVDAPKDRHHPIKKNRPIASGKLPVQFAWATALALIFSALLFSVVYVGTYFTVLVIAYLLIQLFYSLYLRNVIILDSLVVATGFVIRVFAGGIATTTSLSSWLILTTIGLSLLLAFGKRRSEKTLLRKHLGIFDQSETRATLRHYPDSLLDSMISMSASFCILSYSLFAFQTSSDIVNESLKAVLPSILSTPKWMMLTIPFIIYGVARYLYVIYEKEAGESPERVLLSDKPLLITVSLWIAFVFLINYAIPTLTF